MIPTSVATSTPGGVSQSASPSAPVHLTPAPSTALQPTAQPIEATSERAHALAASIPEDLAGVRLLRTGVDGSAVLSGLVSDCEFICISEVKAFATAAAVEPAAIVLGDAIPAGGTPFETWPVAVKVIRVDKGRGDLGAAWIAASVALGGSQMKDAWAKVEIGGHTVWHQLRALGGVDLPPGARIYVYQSGDAIVDVYVATRPASPSVDDLMRALFDAFPPGPTSG